MIKKIIKNRITGKIIFEFSKENNTIKDTVQEYIKKELESEKSYADLRYADLSSANLSSANLSSADLRYADLRYANLRYADLSYANLSSANLSYANLSYANLSSADLDKRYLSITRIGSSNRMTTYCFDDDVIWCGCFKGTLQEFENKVNETHKNNELYLKQYLGAINYIKSLK